jgi:hypothetical protein
MPDCFSPEARTSRLRKKSMNEGYGLKARTLRKQKHWALATEGGVFGRETCPRGLKAAWLSNYMYGLKAVPFRKRFFPQPARR